MHRIEAPHCRRVEIREIEGGWFKRRPCESTRAYVARVNRQSGLGLSERGNVRRIRDALLQGHRFGPIVLAKRGAWLHIVDGWHRVCAAGELALRSVYAAIFEPATTSEENAACMFILESEERGVSPADALFTWARLRREAYSCERLSYV